MSGKVTIRRGVFETNSSSTHSMQIVKSECTYDEIINAIAKRIRENLKKKEEHNEYNHLDDFIKIVDGKRMFVLEGLDIFGSDYDYANYTTAKISTDIAKIQYLFTDFVSVAKNSKEYDTIAFNTWDTLPKYIEKLKSFKNFSDALMEYFNMHKDVYGVIDGVVIEDGYLPVYYFDEDDSYIFTEEDIYDFEKVRGKLHYILSCGNDIIYRNFDYHEANVIPTDVY